MNRELQWQTQLSQTMQADRHRLRKMKQRLKRLQPDTASYQHLAAEFQQRLAVSADLLRKRRALCPRLESPADLPITAYRQRIVDLLHERQVLVVCGETGSGKSTQLPKYCLEAGLGRAAMIGHTQPRRLAARSIAARLQQELECPPAVGCKIRFADDTADDTLVKLMTDGILLAETQSDHYLDRYDAIIIDEAHERSLNIDFLLGYLRRLQGKRPELKIIITSATIDAQRFAEHFADESGPAPILQVEGRGFPVEILYLPWQVAVQAGEDQPLPPYDLGRHVIAGVEEIFRHGPGDILVFLPTERDIRDVSHRLAGHFKRTRHGSALELLPLYARLPQTEQQQIFQPSGNQRRIVLATNVAESSLTVPRIHFVIDAGTARMSRYSPRSKVQRLPIEAVSRASANQRAGRCGRIAPGVCVRLYSEADYESRSAFTTPEIRRANLASVILQTKVLKLGQLDRFPLLDVPRPESIREGMQTLRELRAIDQRDDLTEMGWQLGRMPVDPRVGRMLLAAAEEQVLPEVLVIAAALEIQDPRERPAEKRQAADEAHQPFRDPDSDFLGLLRLWRFLHQQQEILSRSRFRKACRTWFISYPRFREWNEIYRQLRRMVSETLSASQAPRRSRSPRNAARKSVSEPPRLLDAPTPADPIIEPEKYAAIHRAVLSGLLSGIAQRQEEQQYRGVRGLDLRIWPGSGLSSKSPQWIVAAELVETTRQYARNVARIQPEWLEALGTHLVRHQYSDAHWSSRARTAFCYQTVLLFGLPIVSRRRVPLAPVDPETARQLLIDQGLAEGKLPTSAKLVRHNERLLGWIKQLAAKTRARDFDVDPLLVAQFYRQRLPAQIVDSASLEKWDRGQPQPAWAGQLSTPADLDRWLANAAQGAGLPVEYDPQTPYMNPFDLLPSQTSPVDNQRYPEHFTVGQTRLPLSYHFEPGSPRDGVTVTVPQPALPQISEQRLGWLVPGLLETKLTALIKSLPKRIRRNLVPAAEVARAAAAQLANDHGEVPFLPAVCKILTQKAEIEIRPSDFSGEKVPDHLRLIVKVVDEDGKTIAEDRDLDKILQQIPSTRQNQPAAVDAPGLADGGPRTGIADFTMTEMPKEVKVRSGGVVVTQYPAYVDCGESVSLELFAAQTTAHRQHAGGVTRLFALTERRELRAQVRWLPGFEQHRVKLASLLKSQSWQDALPDLLARLAFVEGQSEVRSAAEFRSRRANRAQRIAIATQWVAQWLPKLADAFHRFRGQWETFPRERLPQVVEDIARQQAWLARDRFLAETPWQWLQHYPRYYLAMQYRLEKLLSGNAARDLQLLADLGRLQAQISGLPSDTELTAGDAEQRQECLWLMQELRVSLFAQPLGTAEKVSIPRIEKLLRRFQSHAATERR